MSYLYKRGPVFYYDFQWEGVRYNGSTKRRTKREAREFVDALRRKVRQQSIDGYSEELSFSEGVQAYNEAKLPTLRSPAGVKSTNSRLLEIIPAHLKWSDISTEVVDDLRAHLEAKGYKPNSIGLYVSRLQAIYRWIKRYRKAVKLDTSVEWDKPKRTQKFRVMSDAEERALFAEVTDRAQGRYRDTYQDLSDLLTLLIDTGCRISEAVTVTWDSYVPGSKPLIEVYRHKTDTVDRLPVSERLDRALLARRARRKGTSPFIFPGGQEGHKPTNLPVLSALFDALGFNSPTLVQKFGRFTIHSLRHTYATRLIRAGVTPPLVMKLLGHTSLNTTMVYVTLTDEDAIDAGRKALTGRPVPSPDMAQSALSNY